MEDFFKQKISPEFLAKTDENGIVRGDIPADEDIAVSREAWSKIFDFDQKGFEKDRENFDDIKRSDHIAQITANHYFNSNTVYLELGCGPAYIGEQIMAEFDSYFIGVDFNYDILLCLKKYFNSKGYKKYLLVHGDIKSIPLKDNTVDFIYGGGVIEHLKDTDLALKECWRILRPGGVCFNTVPAFNIWWLTRFYNSIPALPGLRSLFDFVHTRFFGNRILKGNYGYCLSFTPRSLARLYDAAGFKDISINPFAFHPSTRRVGGAFFRELFFKLQKNIFTAAFYRVSGRKEKLKILICNPNDGRMKDNMIFDDRVDVNLSVYKTIRKYLLQNSVSLDTLDKGDSSAADYLIFHNTPYPWKLKIWRTIFKYRRKCILLSFEPPIVNPFNYFWITRFFFREIYTWKDDLVDGKKYFKLYYPQSLFGFDTKAVDFKNKSFLTLINGNKLPFWPFVLLSHFGRELYSERVRVIEYFEKNFPDNFDLYGQGWNNFRKYGILDRILGPKVYNSYKGAINDKIAVLSCYKYCLCLENMTDVKGYITEKIFDCFKARCVPVYWGASNIKEFVPEKCFIDFRDFDGDYGKLAHYLGHLSEEEYNEYIKNIEKLLSNQNFLDTWFEAGAAQSFLKIFN